MEIMDSQLASLLHAIDHSNEKKRHLDNRKSEARSTGEKVAHLMFRKSGFIKEHEKIRLNDSNVSDSRDKFDEEDIQKYN